MLLNCGAKEDSWESLGQQEDKTSQSQRKSTWIFTGRANTEAEAPILWPPDMKLQLIGKDHDAGQHWGQEDKEVTEDEMVRWHHWLKPELSKLWEMMKDREALCPVVHRVTKSQTQLSHWTTYFHSRGWLFIALLPYVWWSLFIFFRLTFFLISWRLITLQYCSVFCRTLTWISLGYTCIPHPDPPFHLPLHPIPLSLPSAPGLSTCLMHPTWAKLLYKQFKYSTFI